MNHCSVVFLRGKRRSPNVAAFEIDCDRHLLALQRELAEGRYQPSPWRLHVIRDPKTRLILVLFAEDRALLLDARAAVGDWLREQRALRLNPKRLAVEPTWTPATFVGYRISRAGIAPGRKLRWNFRRRLRAAAERGEESLIRTIRSYRGLLVFP